MLEMLNGSEYFFPIQLDSAVGGCVERGGRWLLREAVSQADAAAAKYINPRCGGLTRMEIAWGRPSPNRPSLPPLSTPFTNPKGHSRG